jgi:SAM-dependent methyltransferase
MNVFDHRSISQLLLGIQYLSHKHKYRFLDIGSGPGLSFVSARNILGNVNMFAIESNNDAKTFYIKFLEDITICDNLTEIKDEIDVVLMSHSLEHFDIIDIKGLFQDIYDVLGDNGLVIIEVPNVDLRDSNILKRRLNDTPHLSFFSLESLLRLVKKFDFELCFINTVGQLQIVSDSRENNIKGDMDFKNLKILLKDSIKKASKYIGLHEYLYKINTRLKNHSAFYNNINFRYGGDRDCLRCVLRKSNSVLKH